MGELLTTQEVASYLKLSPATVHRRAQEGEIPAIRIGKQFRFEREGFDRWLRERSLEKAASVLVVDDEPIVGELLKDTLYICGYTATTTLSSTEALEYVRERRYDLIFLDLAMPDLDGAELFKQIRALDRNVPVAIVTGYPDGDLMAKAMRHGPFLVIKKPFVINDILGAVRLFSRGLAMAH